MRIIFLAILLLSIAGLFITQSIQAQNVIYLSNTNLTADNNLVQNQTGIMFKTGTNAAGYKLNSVSILFATSSYSTNNDGGYTGFLLTLYDQTTSAGVIYSGGFNGNFAPTNAGLYVYIPNSNTILTPNTSYILGLFAGSESLPTMSLTTNQYAAITNGGWSLINSYGTIFAIEAMPVAPPLVITQVDHQINISWQLSSAGFTLQTNSDLSATNWGNYSGTINNNSVNITPSSKSLFFRWR